VVVLLVHIQLGAWRPIQRTAEAVAFHYSDHSGHMAPIGRPHDDLPSAVRELSWRLSPLIYRRLKLDPTFRACLLAETAQAVLDDDVKTAQALLRRVVDATIGFDTLASLMSAHPKSLIRMLSSHGNPTARHLTSILARVAFAHGVRLRVHAISSRPPGSSARPRR
jgi:DNA-binding phage protein